MTPINSQAWNELVNSYSNSQIYHLYQWGTLLEGVHGHEPVYLHEDKGVFPLALVKSPIFGNRLISLPFADYGGPCACNKEVVAKLISKCQEIAQQLKVDFIEARSPDSQYFETFEKQDFVKRNEYLTFVLRLDKGIEELWKGIGDKNRNMVRKAERNGVQIVAAENKDDLKAFYSLYQKTMKRLGSPPQPYNFFGKIWDLFYPQNLIMPLAVHKGEHIAAGLFFLHNDIIHHAYSCSLEEYLKLAPNDLIQWSTIKWGNEHSFKYLDFGRTREDEGTVLFKRRWGGEPVKMPYFYKFYKKGLNQRQETQYRWASRLWSKYMPEFIANRIGPWIIKQVG